VINLDTKRHGHKMEEAKAAVVKLLEAVGYDLEDSPHLADTPRRVAEALIELTTPIDFEFTKFKNYDDAPIEQMVAVTDIGFVSLCAHHLLPFVGTAHVAYIPHQLVAGISKLARAVELFAHGLNMQEELTQNIADFLQEELDPLGVAVIIRAEHQCMSIRGVTKPGSKTVTSALKGVFLDPTKQARQEFLSLVNSNGRH
jgi:GTP cyclohydrolase IA